MNPRTAFHDDEPCSLVLYHAPVPVMTAHHHTRPEYLQRALWGEVRFGPDKWVCSSCHDSIHAWLYWLMGDRRKPPRIGLHAKAEAERTHQWYLAEKEKLK